MGELTTRTERTLPQSHVTALADTFHSWQETPSARQKGLTYADIPGFCYAAGLDEVRACEYMLTPGRYVGPPATGGDAGDEPADAKIARLARGLSANFAESARLEQAVRRHLDLLTGSAGVDEGEPTIEFECNLRYNSTVNYTQIFETLARRRRFASRAFVR